MESVKEFLFEQYLKWQQELGKRGTITAWAKHLDPDSQILTRANLAALMRGDNTQPSMRVAYLLYEKTGNSKIMEILGYPIPNNPLVDFTPKQQDYILEFIHRVKKALSDLSPEEQDVKLKEILESKE